MAFCTAVANAGDRSSVLAGLVRLGKLSARSTVAVSPACRVPARLTGELTVWWVPAASFAFRSPVIDQVAVSLSVMVELTDELVPEIATLEPVVLPWLLRLRV